jgi:hypothetical protein
VAKDVARAAAVGAFSVKRLGHFGKAVAFAACVFMASQAQANTVLYDNGSTTGNTNAQEFTQFGNNYEISDSLTLSQAASVGSVNFTSWLLPSISGGHTISIQWGITATANSFSSFIAGGTASVTSTLLFTNTSGFNVYSNTFSRGTVSLAAGTYYLVLAHATAEPSQNPNANGDPSFWDENDGPSTATQQVTNFSGTTTHSIGSETFQIISAETPWPAALPPFAIGVGALALLGRRWKRKVHDHTADLNWQRPPRGGLCFYARRQ